MGTTETFANGQPIQTYQRKTLCRSLSPPQFGGDIADSILVEPFGLKDKYHARESFDGKHYVFTFDKSVNNDKEEFEKNYGNPLCDVTVQRSTFVVEENEDKICLKVFYCGKHRKAQGSVFS